MFPHRSDYMSEGSQVSVVVFFKSVLESVSQSVSQSVSHKGTYRAVRGQLKILTQSVIVHILYAFCTLKRVPTFSWLRDVQDSNYKLY